MKTTIKNLFSKTYSSLITIVLILFIVEIEFVFSKNSLNINIFGELLQATRRILLIFLTSSMWTITIFHLLFTTKKTEEFANKYFNQIFKITFGVIFAIHLPFALGIELFSFFATFVSIPIFTHLFNILKQIFQFIREENVVTNKERREAPKYKRKQRHKQFQKIRH